MHMLGLEKAEQPEIKLPTFVGSQKKQKNSRKTSTSASLTTLKPLTVWITRNCGIFFKRWEYQTTLPVFWETCMQVKKQHLELDWFKLGKEFIKAVYCHPAYLTYVEFIMWNARLDEAQARIKMARKISIISDMQMIPSLWQKVKRT